MSFSSFQAPHLNFHIARSNSGALLSISQISQLVLCKLGDIPTIDWERAARERSEPYSSGRLGRILSLRALARHTVPAPNPVQVTYPFFVCFSLYTFHGSITNPNPNLCVYPRLHVTLKQSLSSFQVRGVGLSAAAWSHYAWTGAALCTCVQEGRVPQPTATSFEAPRSLPALLTHVPEPELTPLQVPRCGDCACSAILQAKICAASGRACSSLPYCYVCHNFRGVVASSHVLSVHICRPR